jgi:hypothetical protein
VTTPGRQPAVVRGGDPALARAVGEGARRVRFEPDASSDLARALGLGRVATGGGPELALDALRLVEPAGLAVNAVVLGTAPDQLRRCDRRHGIVVRVDGRVVFDGRAAGVVVAVGEFLRGLDVVPRGHPGDGVAEVQVYALAPGERPEMRRRLRAGAHVPHPRIRERTGARVDVRASRPLPLEVDGERVGRVSNLSVEVVRAAYAVCL